MKALIAFSDSENMMAVCSALTETDVDLELCSTISDLRAHLKQDRIDLVFCQARFEDGTFRDLLRLVDSFQTGVAVVVCSDFYDKGTYIEAMSLGAFDYLAFPYRKSEVEWVIGNAEHGSSMHRHSLQAGTEPSAHSSSPAHA
jgi:DNA-binding NtrC family response regulator